MPRLRKPKPKKRRSSATLPPLPPKPRAVFFGTSEFAVPALEAFAREAECVLVVTQPDRPSGRGQKLQPTPVKLAARALGISTTEPLKIRDVLSTVIEAAPELYAVASYGKILPQALLDVPALGALNVHPSLLPLYRGATPLQSQLRDGVTESGVTIIFMDAGMDTGDIVLARRAQIGAHETYGELHERFATLGGELLAQACKSVRAGTAVRTPQGGLADPATVERTVTRPIEKDDLVVDWTWPAARIVNHVRSLSPNPGARARLDGEEQMVKLLDVRITAGYDSGDLVVACGAGEFVSIQRLVPPNRKPMTGSAYRAAMVSR